MACFLLLLVSICADPMLQRLSFGVNLLLRETMDMFSLCYSPLFI